MAPAASGAERPASSGSGGHRPKSGKGAKKGKGAGAGKGKGKGTSRLLASGQREGARAAVGADVDQLLRCCTVFVTCVSRKFTVNANNKKVVLHCRALVDADHRHAPDMMYVMIQGDFTTESHPHNCRSGWMGYIFKSCLWKPAWNKSHVEGAANHIYNTVYKLRNVIRLDPLNVLYIETRGRLGVMPAHFLM